MHKCKFVFLKRGGRKTRTLHYKCHGCFKILYMRKRVLRRTLLGLRKGHVKSAILSSRVDTKDPRYIEMQDQAMAEIFSYEFNHPGER